MKGIDYNMKKGKIYCCFSGTGKTQADVFSLIVDLDRHFYMGDVSWENIIDLAVTIAELGRNVALGSDLFLRRKLRRREISYTVVIPNIEDKEVYRQRYIGRSSSTEHIATKCDNWEVLLSEKLEGEEIDILPNNGNLTEYLVEKSAIEDSKTMMALNDINTFLTIHKPNEKTGVSVWEMDISNELVSALNCGTMFIGVIRAYEGTAPTFAISNNSLMVCGHGAKWYSVDIQLEKLGLATGAKYRLIAECECGTCQLQMYFLLNGVPYEFGVTETDENVLVTVFTYSMPAFNALSVVPPNVGLRICNDKSSDFTIRSIKIERIDGEYSNEFSGDAVAWKEVIESSFFGKRGAGTTLTPTNGGIIVGSRAKNIDGFAIDILGLRQFVSEKTNGLDTSPTIVIRGTVDGILGDIKAQGFTSDICALDDGTFTIVIKPSDEFDEFLSGDWPHVGDWLWETGWDAGLNQATVLSSMIRSVRNGIRPAIVLTTVGNPHPQLPPPHSLGNYTITSITVDNESIFKILGIDVVAGC